MSKAESKSIKLTEIYLRVSNTDVSVFRGKISLSLFDVSVNDLIESLKDYCHDDTYALTKLRNSLNELLGDK